MGKINFKKCIHCKEIKVATREFFGPCGSTKDGLTGDCKKCRSINSVRYKNLRAAKNKAFKKPDLCADWMNGIDGVYC